MCAVLLEWPNVPESTLESLSRLDVHNITGVKASCTMDNVALTNAHSWTSAPELAPCLELCMSSNCQFLSHDQEKRNCSTTTDLYPSFVAKANVVSKDAGCLKASKTHKTVVKLSIHGYQPMGIKVVLCVLKPD